MQTPPPRSPRREMHPPPPRSPRRIGPYTSPPHSPSLSLSGLERPVPRTSTLSQTSFLLPSTPPHTRSYDSLPSKLNKPLPKTPFSESANSEPRTRPTSSIYSQNIDETVQIIESYAGFSDQRKASSTQTLSHSRFDLSPKDAAPEYLSSRSYSDRSERWTEKSPLSSASVSLHSSNIAPSQTSLPMHSPRPIGPTPRQREREAAAQASARREAPSEEVNIALSFDSIPYDSTFGHFPVPISPRVTDIIDHSLVPRPLDPRASARGSSTGFSGLRYEDIAQPVSPISNSKPSKGKAPVRSPAIKRKKKYIGTSFLDLDDLDDAEDVHSHFSRTSSSDDSWVLHPSFTDHLVAAVKDKIRPKSKGKTKEKMKQKERERVVSYAEAKYPNMNPGRASSSSEAPSRHRRGSQTLRRGSQTLRRGSRSIRRGSQSLRRGSVTLKNAIYDAARKFSLSSSGGSKSRKNSVAGPSQPKRREKTLAIPTSPYQRYGAKIWEAPKKQKKTKVKKEKSKAKLWRTSWRGHTESTEQDWMVEAVRARRVSLPLLSQHHVEGQLQKEKERKKEKGKHEKEERRRSSALQHGSKEVASAFERLTLRRSSMDGEEKRRAKLKASIRLIGPSDQFADGRVNHWL